MTVCSICDGVGLVRVVDAAGNWVSRPCECQEAERVARRLAATWIPRKYLNCTLDTFEIGFNGAHPSLGKALQTARKFVDVYPVDTGGKGLLIVGSNGVGKTHLAIGVLRRLVRERGVKGLFCDYRELLKKIQNSYNPQVQATELDLLTPLATVEVLVIDDLGTQKPSDWVWDTVAYILNARYNGNMSTIITTHFPDLPAGSGELKDAEKAARHQTLGDRIGDTMRSRLAEMCIKIEMAGRDIRESVKQARFG